ncbi:MAG: 50S ribosomal protein L6 [Candidatus Firestonebacteria bacterium]
MSRVGNNPINIPAGVKVLVKDGNVMVEGPKGKLSMAINNPGITIEIKDGKVVLSRSSEEKLVKAAHGTMRAHVNNLVTGVVGEFSKTLQVEGVGYKAALEGQVLVLYLGFTHSIRKEIPKGLSCTVEKNTTITVKGADREMLGNFCAKLRKLKNPDPYKGKGIKFMGEYIRRKAGKTATGTTGGGK